jgi:type IV pilus assembly protein PilF
MNRLLPVLLLAMLASCASSPRSSDEITGVTEEVVQKQLELGIGYLRQRSYQRAKDNLNRALDLDPKNAEVHEAFGLLFQLEGEYELAEKHFADAVRFGPDNAKVRNSFGAFLFSQQRFPEAIEQLSKASENRFYPNRPAVFQNLGLAYLRVGDKENADYAFTRAIQLNPDQARALLELASIRYEQRNYVEARELYRRHTRLSPKTPKTLLLCVRLARIFRDQNEEASCAEALEGIFPSSPEYKEYRESL